MPINYKDYPPNWKSEIVPRILKRAENKCEVCGLENGERVRSYNIFVRMKGRYKLKAFWDRQYEDGEGIQDDTNWIRKEPFVHSFKWVGVVLTIAHLDHDEKNHEVKDDRLKAMCQYCHLNYDAHEKMRKIMLKET